MTARERWKKVPILLLLGLALIVGIGCEEDEEGPVTPVDPTPTALPTATPTGDWGYVSGYAEVMVTGLPSEPSVEKENIWCLGHPSHTSWTQVRHRHGSTFQLKGGVRTYSHHGCEDEQHYTMRQPMGNGVWTADWGTDGHITINSPTGHGWTLWAPDGQFAFRHVEKGACGGYVPFISPYATVELLHIEGVVGYPEGC